MSDIWVVVPTAGRDTLTQAIDSTGIPRNHTVVILTRDDITAPDGCHTILDLEPINIHRWWNKGIEHAISNGARYIAVINDDVMMDQEAIPQLVSSMNGYSLSSPGYSATVTNPDKGHPMSITGSCFVIDTTFDLRPDEGYRWWYGDNDLDWKARKNFGGLVLVPVNFQHLTPNHLTLNSYMLQELAQMDKDRWSQQ